MSTPQRDASYPTAAWPMTRPRQGRVRPIRHDGSCGQRIPCPAHGRLGLYNPAELLRNGDTLAHDCGQTWRPHELSRVAS